MTCVENRSAVRTLFLIYHVPGRCFLVLSFWTHQVCTCLCISDRSSISIVGTAEASYFLSTTALLRSRRLVGS